MTKYVKVQADVRCGRCGRTHILYGHGFDWRSIKGYWRWAELLEKLAGSFCGLPGCGEALSCAVLSIQAGGIYGAEGVFVQLPQTLSLDAVGERLHVPSHGELSISVAEALGEETVSAIT